MPRPKSKEELSHLSQHNYQKLLDLIHSYPIEEANNEFPKGTLNRKISDVLAHLYHWHTMMLDWYEIGMKGDKPDMPAKGYTWRTLPALNQKIWELHQHKTLKEAETLFKKSHAQINKLIETHSNEELFEKKRYQWTGSTSLGAYFISCTSSHYDWAIKLIKKAKR